MIAAMNGARPSGTLRQRLFSGLASALLLPVACMVAPLDMAEAAPVPTGCFARTYDAAHMRGHSSQQVRRLWVRIEESRYDRGNLDFGLNLWARGKAQVWRAGGRCEPGQEGLRCRPDTDGASELLLTLEGRTLRLSNPGRLKIIDDETGPDLNDMLIGGPGDAVFLLAPAPASACRDKRS